MRAFNTYATKSDLHLTMPSLRSLGLAVERTAKQYRWLLRYSHSQRVRQAWITKNDSVKNSVGKTCLLDLRRIANDGEQGRRFHALVRLLQRGGYDLSLVPRLQFLQTGHRPFKASALASVQPFHEDSLPSGFKPFDLCLTDGKCVHRLAKRTINVIQGTSQSLADGDLAMPYSFFPAVWDHGEDARFEQYRQKKRVWRLFFGGHCSKASYARISKYTRIRPVDRHTVVQELLDYFACSTVQIRSDRQLESAQQRRHDAFVMIDNGVYRTQPSRWLGLLAQSDFFVAAPGCDYPLSHNAIESLAVGTIPVLEYGSLFTPELRDGENCIAYQGLDGLRQAATRIETMSHQEIHKLRQGVIEYYESHLSPAAFCRQLEDERTTRLHLFPYLTPPSKAIA